MIPFPDNKYKLIYADPPWSYENKKTGGHSRSLGGFGSGRNKGNSAACDKYEVMDLGDICDLPVDDISQKNSCLFLWATTPLLNEAFDVMDSWGFNYKTAIYWRKIMSLGMGYWFRGQVEVCLFGIKGKIPAFHCQKPNFIQCRVGEHSKKPKEFRGLLTQLADQHKLNPKIELFSRERIEGWDCWGNEIPSSEQKLLKVM